MFFVDILVGELSVKVHTGMEKQFASTLRLRKQILFIHFIVSVCTYI